MEVEEGISSIFSKLTQWQGYSASSQGAMYVKTGAAHTSG
jgi:hypothetical protein